MKFHSSEIDVEVLFVEVESEVPFLETSVEGQIHIKAAPSKELKISVHAKGPCFQKLGKKNRIHAEVKLGGVRSGFIHSLRNGETKIINGWRMAKQQRRFKTSAANTRYESTQNEAQTREAKVINEVVVKIKEYKISKARERKLHHASRLKTTKEVIKREKDDKKFFKYASLAFDAGSPCGKPRKYSAEKCTRVRNIAEMKAVMEEPHISDLRAAQVQPKADLISCQAALVDLTMDSTDESDDIKVQI